MNEDALRLLERLIEENLSREKRLLELLRDPESNCEGSWAMYLPAAFNDALDIRRTERVEKGGKFLRWTQGSSFSFKAGDTIYDVPQAYEVWEKALKYINLCVKVKQPTTANLVSFVLMTPNKDRTKLVPRCNHALSQGDFVRFLISGPDDELKAKLDD